MNRCYAIVAIGIAHATLVACGENRRTPFIETGDRNESETMVSIQLPDRTGLRAQVPNIDTKMDGYLLYVHPCRISGNGRCENDRTSSGSCVSGTQILRVGDYSNTVTLTQPVTQGCNYNIRIALGKKPGTSSTAAGTSSTTTTATSSKVTYKKDIQPIIQDKCVSCHPGDGGTDLRSYTQAKREIVVSRVVAGTMPNSDGGGALPQAQRDLFQKWQDDGFLLGDTTGTGTTTTVTPSATGNRGLAETYYKNDEYVVVRQREIQGRSQLRIDNFALQVQRAGRAIGLGRSATSVAPIRKTGTTPINSPINNPINNPVGTGMQTVAQLPLQKNLNLISPRGQTTLSNIFRGQYMLLDFSAASCPLCIQEANNINRRPDLQTRLNGTRCSMATLVPQTDIVSPAGGPGSWHRAIGGANNFVGSHSYGVAGNRIVNQLQLFSPMSTRIPTFLMIDRQGNVVGQPVVAQSPVLLISQFCQ